MPQSKVRPGVKAAGRVNHREAYFEADDGTLARELDLKYQQGQGAPKVRTESEKRTQRYREKIWAYWHMYMKKLEVTDHRQVWRDLVFRDPSAKERCKGFLEYYVNSSYVPRPDLDSGGSQQYRTISSSVTLQDVWATLVMLADTRVMDPLRQQNPHSASIYRLSYSSQDGGYRNGPAYEVAKDIPDIALKLDLTLNQTFEKREATTDDVMLILDTIWRRGRDIPCSAQHRFAFHCAVLLGGTGGWRPASTLCIKYRDVAIEWVRDGVDRNRLWPVATIAIYHVKQQKKVQRKQRHMLKYSVTRVPCPALCLLTLLTSKGIIAEAFDAGFTRPEQVLEGMVLEEHLPSTPLRWKADFLDKSIFQIPYDKYLALWNRTLLVAGGRDGTRPYSLRVGTGARLNGSLEPAVRNFTMSQSSAVFEMSYQPRQLGADLVNISFPNVVGPTDTLIQQMRSATLRRDERAPIYPSRKDIEEQIETRPDMQELRRAYREVATTGASQCHEAKRICRQIQHLKDILGDEIVRRKRQNYFQQVDRLRARALPTDHLWDSEATTPRLKRYMDSSTAAEALGGFMARNNDSAFTSRLLAFLRGNAVEGLAEGIGIPREKRTSDARCLLCSKGTFANPSSLTRHVWRVHEALLRTAFACPECRLNGEEVIISSGPPSWSNHVETVHGRHLAPRLIWNEAPKACCLLCGTSTTPRGFSRHLTTHLTDFMIPFPCPACKEDGHDAVIDGQEGWIQHVKAAHHGHQIPGAVLRAHDVVSKKRKNIARAESGRSIKRHSPGSDVSLVKDELLDLKLEQSDGSSDSREPSVDLHADEEFWVTGDIPIDPLLQEQ